MIVRHPPDVSDRFTTTFIRRTAQRLVAQGAFRRDELEDLVQDLTVDLLDSWHRFMSARARWSTFVRAVVTRRAVSLRRRQQAEIRQEELTSASLAWTTPSDDEGEGELVQPLTRSDTEHLELAHDVEQALQSLPGELRIIAEGLRTTSVAALARELGMPRSTLICRIRRLREHFAALGLEDYVHRTE